MNSGNTRSTSRRAPPHKESGIRLPAGFRLPAEWEPQEAVWLSWPHRKATWQGRFRSIPAAFARVVAAISRFEKVRINLNPELVTGVLRQLVRARTDLAQIELFPHPTNDAWCRDHGPIFVRNDRTGEVAVTDWEFNSWGGKYLPFDDDNAVPAHIAKALGMRRFRFPMVLEGGSIDVNGKGVLLTTESCLLNPNRNPGLSRAQIERNLKAGLGVKQVLWLGDGIAGDDTDGHVDDLARFFADDGIVAAVEKDPRDVNHRALCGNLERLKGFRTPAGKRFRIVELPMPRPCCNRRQRLPATYANFLVINGAVLMPSFRQPRRDAEAAEILSGCFPGRTVVPVDCFDIVHGRGTLHCLSQQQPVSRASDGAGS